MSSKYTSFQRLESETQQLCHCHILSNTHTPRFPSAAPKRNLHRAQVRVTVRAAGPRAPNRHLPTRAAGKHRRVFDKAYHRVFVRGSESEANKPEQSRRDGIKGRPLIPSAGTSGTLVLLPRDRLGVRDLDRLGVRD